MAAERSIKINMMPIWVIAPCGMNCRLCKAYVREKNPCPGCRTDDNGKPKTRVNCRIKTCENIKQDNSGFCFKCNEFPCARLNHLDERYRRKYGMSMIDNLRQIKEAGIRQFIRNEKEKWTCPRCGSMICVHEPQCYACGLNRR